MPRLVALLGAFVLSMTLGCAAFGVSAPESFNQGVLAATRTSQTVLATAISLRSQNALSDRDRDNIVSGVRTAEQGIDIAVAARGACPKDALGSPAPVCADAAMARLQVSIVALNALQAYLATKGTKP